MSPSGEDVKPDTSKIKIAVQFNGKQLTFLYKKDKPISKLLDIFCVGIALVGPYLSGTDILHYVQEKESIDRRSVRFNFNGKNVEQEGLTPKMLGMEEEEEEDNVIDGQLWQEGGSF
ncbi:hypothetical protein FB451DRAFT_1407864 [Mycena latifolia]|nr:hypothetical protein FB451DRAFT_1407864 [Mycena latifolia]